MTDDQLPEDALQRLAELAAEVRLLRADVDELQDAGVPGRGYQPVPAPRWWALRGEARAEAVDRLRAWVEQVYKPGYGHVADGLPPCWYRHHLALFAIDWLSELHSFLYLQPTRLVSHLGGQAEWQTRFLPAVAEMITKECKGCTHAQEIPVANGRPAS